MVVVAVMEWYELALLAIGTLMVGGVVGWIVVSLVRLGREDGEE